MIGQSFQNDAIFDEIHRLATACLEGGATTTTFEQLKELVSGDPDTLELYVEYLSDSMGLRCIVSPSHEAEVTDIASPADVKSDISVDSSVSALRPESFPQNGFLSLPATLGYLSSGWPMAYLVAMVIMGIGLAVMAVVHVSHPMKIATHSQSVMEQQRTVAPKAEIVGRITGIIDCKWDDPDTQVINGDHVPLGRKYSLASGLMEITYGTGSRVILQGPVTYEVEAKNGGYMSVGKLTGKATTEAARGLTIRTPTATVTDLGTEFGVEVDKNGMTRSHVFRGSVRLESIGSDGARSAPRIVHANESAAVERDNSQGRMTVQPIVLDPTVFVRSAQLAKLADEQKLKPFQRWQAYSNELRRDPSLLAYYDFQQKPGEPGVLSNVAANGNKSLDGVVQQATWTNGRMPGKHALLFQNESDYVQLNLPQTVDDLTLAAWVNVTSLHQELYKGRPSFNGLLMSATWNRSGQVHWQFDSQGRARFTQFGINNGRDGREWKSSPVFDQARLGRWTHVAVTFDRSAQSRFYVNGRLIDDIPAENRQRIPICIGSAQIGGWEMESRIFNGWIDELAVFGRVLGSDNIQKMFEAGKPAQGDKIQERSSR